MYLINNIQLLSTISELSYCYFQSVLVFIVSSDQFWYVVSPNSINYDARYAEIIKLKCNWIRFKLSLAIHLLVTLIPTS